MSDRATRFMAPAFAASAGDDSIAALCAALGAQLRGRANALAQAVRDYPTPIARCDDQLTGLLERRSRVMQVRNQLQALGLGAGGGLEDSAGAMAALAACTGALEPGDLDAAFVAQHADALARLRAQWQGRAGGCGPVDGWVNDGGRAGVA